MASAINFFLLIELIVVVIVASAFLFYFNRLLASVITFFIRLYTWRKQSAYISIGSLQLSPLAGRISFRNVEYHSSNISVRALHGHITWRYWKFRVRQEADTLSSNVKRNRLPCRINIYAEGVEGFVFNRTPAYDAIVERMKKHEAEAKNASEETLHKAKTNGSASVSGKGSGENGLGARLRKVAKSTTSQSRDSSEETAQKPDIDPYALPLQPQAVATPPAKGVNWFREALPVELHIVQGSLVLGSDATPMVLVSNFERVDGTLDVSDSRSKCDDYKTSMNLRFEDAHVLMRTNVDYSGPILAHGKKLYDELYKQQPDIAQKPPSLLSVFTGFHALSKRFPFLRDPKFSSPPVAGMPLDRMWKGLARYRIPDENAPRAPHREDREYAKNTKLVTAPIVDLHYFVDTAGPVPHPHEVDHVDDADEFGNIEPPPEYGIDIVLHGALINYGPWADRQRDALQRTFAPSIFFDSEPKPRLRPGETRIHSALVVNIQLAELTTMRIPTREPSQDWRYNAPADVEGDRRYGWLDVRVGANSSITYTQSQFATARGYDAILLLHLDSLAIASSVNMEEFITSQSCKLSMTMPTPLRWDARRDWGLDITLDTPDITLLRDHVQLISDLAKDWSSGLTGDFYHFVPNHYNFRVTLLNYAFHLNINDFNIIDSPKSRDSNAFMDMFGPRMEAYVAVAATQYRPDISTIPFSVDVRDARIELSLPYWDTHRSFGVDTAMEVGKIGHVKADGAYTFYSVPHPDHQETLQLHLEGRQVAFKALGWVLRRLFCIKDNYFGGFTHFTTTQEYLECFDHDPESVGDKIKQKYRPGQSDPFAVDISMNVEDSLIVMSEEIFACERGIAMPVPQLQMALKSVEHFMELSLDATPTYVVITEDLEATYASCDAPPIKSKEALFIEGLELKANRLFGPQPMATTYLCLWEFVAPRITAFLSPELVSALQATVSAVIYNFTDIDNAPTEVYLQKTPPDVTFFKLAIDQVAATYFVGDQAISLDLAHGINLDTSSLATRSFKSAVSLIVPSIDVSFLGHDARQHHWQDAGNVHAQLTLDVYNAPKGWQAMASDQQKFLADEDSPTQRIWFMYKDKKDHVYDHHDHSLYLPEPRPLSPNRGLDVFDDDDDSQISFDASSSSSISFRDVEQAGSHRRRARRSRSFATAREKAANSAGDESDTVSEATSSTGSIASARSLHIGNDMSSALADRLQHFRSIRELPSSTHFATSPAREEPEPGEDLPRRSLDEGTAIRVALPEIDIALDIRTVTCAAAIVSSLNGSKSGERQLDDLLIVQNDAVAEMGSHKSPTLISIDVPVVKLRIDTPDKTGKYLSFDSVIKGAIASVRLDPDSEAMGNDDSSDFALSCRYIRASLIPAKADHTGITIPGDYGGSGITTPVLAIKLESIFLGALVQQLQLGLRAKASVVDLQLVSAALASLDQLAGIWTNLIENVEIRADARAHGSHLLHHIISAAISSDVTGTYPAFAYGSSYGLHVEDQRNIRKDPGWLMIARLRHWSRITTDLSQSDRRPSATELGAFVVTELARLDESIGGNQQLVADQPFLRKVFGAGGGLPRPASAKSAERAFAVFVSLSQIVVRHHGRMVDADRQATSAMIISSVTLGLHRSAFLQDDRAISHNRILVAIRDVQTNLEDSILEAIETILLVAKEREAARKPKTMVSASAEPAAIVVLNVNMGTLQLSATAGGLKTRLKLENVHNSVTKRSASTSAGSERVSSRINLTVACDLVELALLQPVDDQDLITNSPDRVIVSFQLAGIRSVVDSYCPGQPKKTPSIQVIFGIRSIDLDSRPQLRAFLAFAREWQKKHLSQYKPVVEQIQGLAATSRARANPESAHSLPPYLNLDLSIGMIHLQVRAAKAVWLRWEIGKIYVTRQGCAGDDIQFGVKIAPQTVGAYTSLKKNKTKDASAIKLPSLTAIGFHRYIEGRPYVSSTITLGFFTGVLKPAVLDRLLSLHQRLVSDVVHIVQEYRDIVRKELSARHAKLVSSASASTDLDESPQTPSTSLGVRMDLRVSVSGIRFGLRADDVATTLLFEAIALKGHVTNTAADEAALSWRAKVDHFGLSLGHLGRAGITDDVEPVRKHRSAYMVLDIDIREIPGENGVPSQLNVSLNRVHTVMHVAAISEMSDLVKSWQSDIHILRDNRAAEFAEVKTTTTRIVKKLERPAQPEESWFATRLFTVEVVGFGIAIPLDEAAAIDLSHRDNSTVPALLFSIRVINFQNRRNETARFKAQQIALQFLDRFDQGAPEHFQGDFHPSSNRMLLPSLDSQAQMSSTKETWSLAAHCSATDFKLSLAPDVVTGVFKLIDLYEQGKERLLELEQRYRAEVAKREALDSVAVKYEEASTVSPSRRPQKIVVRMSYTFNSGVVELHRAATDSKGHKTTPGRKTWHDTFTLPTISLWVDYNGPRTAHEGSGDASSGDLIFNAAVHESRNTLRPTVLPFFVEMVNRMNDRQRQKHRKISDTRSIEDRVEQATAVVSESTLQVMAPSPGASVNVRVTLRIDRSELRLSCAPDSNAYLDVKWESGGFMASTTLGGGCEVSTVAGSISGVTSSLSHEFADQGRSCVEAGAKDMAFSLTYCPEDGTGDSNRKGLSVVLDTQLLGQFRLDAFSAWLIFVSVWVDNAPKLEVPLRTSIPDASDTRTSGQVDIDDSTDRTGSKQKTSVAALIRFRTIDFDAHVSVSRAKLEISPIVLRTISNGERTEVDLEIGTTQITANGDISGDLKSDRITFRTVRRSSRASTSSDPTVLSMSIDAGDLHSNMFLGDVNILRFHLEPAVVSLKDDWRASSTETHGQVLLAFVVTAGQLHAVVRLLAIPRLLGNLYSVLDLVDSQQHIATQRSEIFKANRLRKSTEPSPMAAVIIQTARRASAAATSTTHVRTAQSMRFDLAGIDIGVFNEDYEDGGQIADFYRFVVGKVEAKLQRSTTLEDVPLRDLHLLISLINWDNSDGARAASREKVGMSARELIDLAWKNGRTAVASIPSMTLKMSSEESRNPPVLHYDFDLVWGETDGDIGIMPNFFDRAYRASKKLVKGLDEQETARLRRIGAITPGKIPEEDDQTDGSPDMLSTAGIEYRPKDPKWADEVPIPKLKQLGESTGEAARLIPRIRSATKEIPTLSHRFVTLPLEEGMDLLLKLYEKQLPERSADR